jgi:hypothetical protein
MPRDLSKGCLNSEEMMEELTSKLTELDERIHEIQVRL